MMQPRFQLRPPDPDAESKARFTIDKKIPIALIITMLVQTLTLVAVGTAWVTRTNLRLEQLEQAVNATRGMTERLTRFEARQESLLNDLAEIKEVELMLTKFFIGYRTILVNLFALAVMMLPKDTIPISTDEFNMILDNVQAAIPLLLPVVNIVLRFVTKAPVGKKP